MENLKQLASEFYETAQDVLKRQSTATPCVYYHDGQVDFSRGDTLGGTAMSVYKGKAVIIIDATELREILNEFDKEIAIGIISERIQDCLEEESE